MLMNTLAHLDLDSGEIDRYWVGAGSSLQEPAFIPAPGSKDEAEGYLIAVENCLVESGSRLLLFRAKHVAAGPIATVALPFRLRPGLHGNWVAAKDLQSQSGEFA